MTKGTKRRKRYEKRIRIYKIMLSSRTILFGESNRKIFGMYEYVTPEMLCDLYRRSKNKQKEMLFWYTEKFHLKDDLYNKASKLVKNRIAKRKYRERFKLEKNRGVLYE